MTVVTEQKINEHDLLDGAAVLYPITKRMLELAEGGDEHAAVRLNRTLFTPGYVRLFSDARPIPRNGGSPEELPTELDGMRNSVLNAFTYSGIQEEDAQIKEEFLGYARESGKRIENILTAHGYHI